jgi:hypothetical protein
VAGAQVSLIASGICPCEFDDGESEEYGTEDLAKKPCKCKDCKDGKDCPEEEAMEDETEEEDVELSSEELKAQVDLLELALWAGTMKKKKGKAC